jgi:Family of unknown function (DUF5335)
MPTREIPKNEWVPFFNSFADRHQGWLVIVEEIGADLGDQIEAEELPLEGISADLKDNEDVITITVGGTPDELVHHAIEQATRVWLKQTDEGADEALQIEAADGRKTLVTFRAPVLPETLDGITPDEQARAGRRRS